jgi:hypothetical protein
MKLPDRTRAEQILVERCLAHDMTAWQQLVEGYDRRLKRAIWRMFGWRTQDRNLVADTAEEVWFRLFTDPKRLQAFDARRSCLVHFLLLQAIREIQRWHRAEHARAVRQQLVCEHRGQAAAEWWLPINVAVEDLLSPLPPRLKECGVVSAQGLNRHAMRPPPSRAAWQKLRQRLRQRLLEYVSAG